jgi:uncharacterized membrane protein YcaP (DUF421 family)
MEITFASILIRVSVMYLLVLALIRLSGKQNVGELSTMDFVVITILGDPFDSVIYSEVTIAEGAVAFTTIVLLHMLVSFLSSRSRFVFRLINSPSTMIIQNGVVQGDGLQKERLRPETVASDMRLRGEDQLEEVKEAWLETNGKLGVVKNTPAKPVQKQDLKLFR